MNCKPGDLALIFRATTQQQHVGKIVTVLYESEHFPGSWRTEPELHFPDGRWISWIDSNLRPLRNQPGEDETLQWLDVPSKGVTA